MRAQIQPVIVIEDVAADKRFEKTVAEKEGTKQVPVQRQNSNLQNKCNQNLCFSTFQQVINKNNSAQLNEIAKMVAEKKTKQQTVHARRRSSVAQDKPKNLENTIDKINKVQLKNPPVSNNREANETELGQNKNKCLRKRSPPESLRNDNAAVTSRRILDRTLIDGIEFQVLGSPIKKRRFSANDAARLPTPAGIKATPNRVLRSSSTRTCAQCGAGEDASSPRRIVGENGKLYCSYDCKNGGCKRAMSTDLQDVNKAEGPIANKMCIQSRPRNQVPEHKIADWTLDEVSKFVELETSSQNLAWRFYEEEIDGRALLLITKEDMIRHLNAKVGHALKVEDSVCKLRK